ncbi:MAG: hypothetical protein UZ08_BCD001001125 [Candidatus Parvibacillus calidus]|jgi:hypothetical protein|nr:MAG: hypothetical protein UZ08_BCD001001125 [Candidatus Parvibacillus calidus]
MEKPGPLERATQPPILIELQGKNQIMERISTLRSQFCQNSCMQ